MIFTGSTGILDNYFKLDDFRGTNAEWDESYVDVQFVASSRYRKLIPLFINLSFNFLSHLYTMLPLCTTISLRQSASYCILTQYMEESGLNLDKDLGEQQ